MKLALFNTALGVLVTVWLGSQILGLDTAELARAIAGSFLGGFVSLIVTTRLEASPRTKRWINSTLKTWTFHSTVYFGILLLCASSLRDPKVFGILILPLLFVTGTSIIAYGPIQDAFVARSQRKARESAHSMR